MVNPLEQRQKKIREIRDLSGMTQAELAVAASKLVGAPVTKDAVRKIEQGKTQNAPLVFVLEQALGITSAPAAPSNLPTADQAMADAFRVLDIDSRKALFNMATHLVSMAVKRQKNEASFLKAWSEEQETRRKAPTTPAAPLKRTPTAEEPTRTLRLVGYVAARSTGALVSLDERLDDEIEVPESRLPRRPKTLQALRVSGDSMAPEIPDGSVVIVAPTADKIQIGRLCVLQVDGEGGVLKRLKRWTRDEVVLESLNPEVGDMTVAVRRLQGVRLKVIDVLKP